MEASYRIVSQADGTFAVERMEPGKEPIVGGHFKTEAEARAHIADLHIADLKNMVQRLARDLWRHRLSHHPKLRSALA
jgi:hypothetical protein